MKNFFPIDRKQKKRILIFLVVPLLALFLFITDDLIVRVVTIALIIVYFAFVIFLRDSLKFQKSFSSDLGGDDPDDSSSGSGNYDDSFEIISKNKNVEIITADNYKPERITQRTSLKPPDLKERFEEIANESIPKEVGHDGQFSFVLEKILNLIRDFYGANSAIFFWYNKGKDKLTIEKYVSNSNAIVKRKFDIEDDILSKIVQKGEPELLSDISPAAEIDVIRYYDSPQGIRSFVGVPLFYDKQLIAILAVDSLASDTFGIETIYSLGRFVRLITMMLSAFEDKYSESISEQRLNGLLNLIGPSRKIDSEEDLILSIQNCVDHLIKWDAFAFVYYKPLEQKFKTIRIKNNTSLKYVGQNLEIELTGTLVGKSIITGVPIKIDDVSANKYVRYSKVEDVSFDGSFLAVPLIYNSQNYGVLCFESLKKNAYTNSDIHFLKEAVTLLSFLIYSYSTQTLLKSFIAVDVETKALNFETFKERMISDLLKAEKLKAPSALALIRIDDFLDQESLFDGNPFPKVLQTVSEMIKNEIGPLSLFGRIDEKIFVIYFFDATTKDVFVWAEKLRVKIARKPIAVVSKQTTYTISVGVASASNKIDVDEIIHNADLALQKAIEKGGNAVRNVN